MKIILDVMGGDNPPAEIIKGALLARKELDARIALVGDESIIRDVLSAEGADSSDFDIIGSDSVIEMEDNPLCIVQKKKNSSMGAALRMLAAGDGDAVVSCGNTGALFTGATLIVHRVPGLRRAALGTVLPYTNNVMLMDCGANVTVTPEYLLHFAHLGSIYMRKLYGIERPRVALVNNGSEGHKGTPLVIEAKALMENDENLNFIGNVEGKELPFDACDVAVCDGFTGNVLLKTSEGLCRFVMKHVIREVGSTDGGKRGDVISALEHEDRFFDVTEYGGAPFIGIAKPVIKAHGNSEANAIKNALMRAADYARADVIGEIEKSAELFKAVPGGGKNEG